MDDRKIATEPSPRPPVPDSESLSRLSLRDMEALLASGLLGLHFRLPFAPTTGDFLAFMRRYPLFTAIGYPILDEKGETHIAIICLEGENIELDKEGITAFEKLSATASEATLELNHSTGAFRAYCFWD